MVQTCLKFSLSSPSLAKRKSLQWPSRISQRQFSRAVTRELRPFDAVPRITRDNSIRTVSLPTDVLSRLSDLYTALTHPASTNLTILLLPTMINKRVQFAPTNIVYSPIPSTPSPCRSTSSLPSSPDIPTPPPELEYSMGGGYPRSPYPRQNDEIYPDQIDPKSMQIHFLLAYAPYAEPALAYDLTLHPDSLNDQVEFATFYEPATQPPMRSILIICPQLKQWDPIEVTAARSNGEYVTVVDVLTAIYDHLRSAVSHSEYATCTERQAVDAAWLARWIRIQDAELRAAEKMKGVKRVDFLLGQNRFLGLSGTLRGPDIWELNVSR